MFDVEKLDTRTKSVRGVEMQLLDPRTGKAFTTNEGKPVTITFFGRNSDAFERIEREISERRVERGKRTVGQVSREEIDGDQIDFLCALTKTWFGFSSQGQEFLPTPENIRAFWSDPRWQWVRQRAETFVLADANFLAD
jgi:hypothetical protein